MYTSTMSLCPSPFRLVLFNPEEQDEEIRKIQSAVAAGMTTNAGHLQTYLKTWDKYRDIWQSNQDSVIQRYRRLNPPVTTVDADIHRHCAIKYKIKFNYCSLQMIFFLN